MFDLKDFYLFNSLTIEEKNNVISELAQPKSFNKGDIIYSAESYREAIGILISGKAQALTNNGNKVLMNAFEEGACFGVAALFGGDSEYVSTVTAKTDTKVLFITEQELTSLFSKYPEIALNYIRFLTEKIRFLNSKLGVLSCQSTEDTLYKYLCSQSDSSGIAVIPKNMTQLSSMLGLSRASLYRGLEALEKEGLIFRENNKIKVIKNEKNS